jgi:hypothetical protein
MVTLPLQTRVSGVHWTVMCIRIEGSLEFPNEGATTPWPHWIYKIGPYAPLQGHQTFIEHITTPRLRDHTFEVFERDLSAFSESLLCHFVVALSSLLLCVLLL